MQQLVQDLRDGTVTLVETPSPAVRRGQLVIATQRTLISAGTERMMLDFGRANWIDKARQQPDKVRMVLERAATDGIAATVDAVRSKLAEPLAPGYCNVGEVIEIGPDVTGFAPGDRVASNGKHAEVVAVPRNLCARIPDNVSDDEAAFTVLGAIALQGIRLAQPSLGETVVVTGLGLIGLLCVQLLRAQGCRVLGIDLNRERLALAERFGAVTVNPAAGEDPIDVAQRYARGRGVDAVIITASTRSSEPIHQAAQMCRQRGRIVLVGLTGLELSRADFYEKELSFQVSCSYGPGRYDPAYEEGGHDYPFGLVRWTEQRNFEAVLDMLATGALDVAPLISHRFPFAQAPAAYDQLAAGADSLGILLEYPPAQAARAPRREVQLTSAPAHPVSPTIAFIGAGNYAAKVLIPAFAATGARLKTIVSSGGLGAAINGRRQGFEQAAAEAEVAMTDPDVDLLVVATRHDNHARYVLDGLRAGKHVFVEKPLCLNLEDLAAIEAELTQRPEQRLMVGFNRRFAPLTMRMAQLLAGADGSHFIMTVNAGSIPSEHWTQDPGVGGGRIIGEACHFIDLLRHLAGSPITHSQVLARAPSVTTPTDTASLALSFENGSTAVVHYLANGHRAFPKERLEVFSGGRILQLDNFRRLRGWGWRGFRSARLWRQDKGQNACARTLIKALREGQPSPIPASELIEVARHTLELAAAAR